MGIHLKIMKHQEKKENPIDPTDPDGGVVRPDV